MIRTHALRLVVPFLAVSALAQNPSQVVPSGAATAEQNASHSPVALDPHQQQFFYTPALLAPLSSGRWTELFWRPDRRGSIGPVSATLSVRLASQGLPALEDASRTDPGANVGTDAVWVARRLTVTFPALAPTTNGRPQATWVRIPFQTPFDYVAGRPLMIEVTFHGPRVALGYSLDALRVPSNPWEAQVSTFGSPCAASGTVSHDLRASNGGRAVFQPFYQDARLSLAARGVFSVGFRRNGWNGLPLPFTLDGIGAPGCEIANSIDILLPSQVYPLSSGAIHTTTISVPRDPNLVGATFYTQGFLFEPGVNALGMLATPSWRLDVTAGPRPLQGLVLTFTQGYAFAAEAPNLLPVFGVS